MIDESTEFGARVVRPPREETVVWLTTVTPSGAPLPRPVGFLWDGGENVSVYSQPGARVRNIVRNPKVTLNFRGDADGGDIVVLSGTRPRWTNPVRAPRRTRHGWPSTPLSGSSWGRRPSRSRSASASLCGFASAPFTDSERPQ
jgi:PPOX class probable F420-dependent enzyme